MEQEQDQGNQIEQNSHGDRVEKIKADRGETLRSQVLLILLLLIRTANIYWGLTMCQAFN